MRNILTNWSLLRELRLLIGVIALVQAVVQKDLVIGLLAGFLLITAFANVGCCGAAGCAIDTRKTKTQTEGMHEELDTEK